MADVERAEVRADFSRQTYDNLCIQDVKAFPGALAMVFCYSCYNFRRVPTDKRNRGKPKSAFLTKRQVRFRD